MSKKLLMLAVPLTVTLAMLVLCEAVLRQFPAFNPRPFFVVEGTGPSETSIFAADPEIGWTLKPHHEGAGLTANGLGFRSKHEFSAHDRPIVFVGDSLTNGTGVRDDEPYPALVAARTGMPVANLAMPGFGVDQIWLTVKHKALDLNPRLIVVGVIDIDFERSQVGFDSGKRFRRPWFRLDHGELVERRTLPNGALLWLDAHSRLLRGIRMSAQTIGHTLPIGEWWNLNAAFLDDIRQIGSDDDIPVLFVNLPVLRWRSFPILRKHMKDVGARFIDITEELPPQPADFFLDDKIHPSAKGHRLIADAIIPGVSMILGRAPAGPFPE